MRIKNDDDDFLSIYLVNMLFTLTLFIVVIGLFMYLGMSYLGVSFSP